MPSPFPGMDPYLEHPGIWEDFHAKLAGLIQDQLVPRLRPRYYAAVTPRVTYDEEVPVKEYAVEVRDTEEGSLVTAIEILSPVNKRRGHDAFKTYRRKRRDILRSMVHLLEIDLLRTGVRPALLTPLPDAPYFIFLSRENKRPEVEIWPLSFREAIPMLPVPLRAPDPDVPLDLGLAIHTGYDRAGYDLRIDYSRPPPGPELQPADAAWVRELTERAKRTDAGATT